MKNIMSETAWTYRQIAKVAAVDSITVAKDEKPPAVYVRISHVNDLQTDYQRLTDVIGKQLGVNYKVVLLDNRTPKLQSLYEQSSFQEAIATGNYQEMRKNCITACRKQSGTIQIIR